MSSELPLSAGQVAEHIHQLRQVVSGLEDQLGHAKAELEWWEQGHRLFFSEDGAGTSAPAELDLDIEPVAPTNGTPTTLRKRVLAVFAQEPRKTWKTKDIIAELRRRELMPVGKYAENHVQKMVAQMGRTGELRKVARGMYRLAPESRGDP